MKTKSVMVGCLTAAAVMLGGAGCGTYHGSPPMHEPGGPPTAVAEPGVAQAAASLLNLRVHMRAATAASDPLVQPVKNAVEGRLAGRRFLISEEATELEVALTVTLEEFDKSGSFVRYNAQADVAVQFPMAADKLVGKQHLAVEGKRELGAEKALADVTARLGDAVADWVTSVCSEQTLGLSAVQVSIRKSWLNFDNMAEYIQAFTYNVGRVPGVARCALVTRDYENRLATFRIVYYPRFFPEGLMNRLESDPALNMRIRK